MITKDMLIGDVVNKYPHAIEIMLSNGLHCVGCSANPYETIEQGAKAHGLADDAIDNMVKQINDQMPEQKLHKDGDIIVSLTEAAAKKAKELMKLGQVDCNRRWNLYSQLAKMDYSSSDLVE